METLLAIFLATWDLYLDAALWLVVGIVAAGVLHVWMPAGLLGKWLGGKGAVPVVKAALIGAPLPLCSCGVLPAAVGLRKDGASKGATVSFLIATPETGPDSVALSYALLGPVMAVVRPIAAIFSAIVSGVLTNVLVQSAPDQAIGEPQSEPQGACCSSTCCGTKKTAAENKFWASLRYGFVEVMDDIALWLAIGLSLAGVLAALVEPQAIASYGSGIWAKLVMVVVGVPIYVCATASTPIAAGLIAVGVSPGAALVFLLVGPATNIATLGVVAKELGVRVLGGYLAGIVVSAIAAGLITDAALSHWAINIPVQIEQVGETVPQWLRVAFGVGLLPLLMGSIARSVRRTISKS